MFGRLRELWLLLECPTLPYMLPLLSNYLAAVVRAAKSLPDAFKDTGKDSPLERIEKLEAEVRELRSRIDFLEALNLVGKKTGDRT